MRKREGFEKVMLTYIRLRQHVQRVSIPEYYERMDGIKTIVYFLFISIYLFN